MDLGLKAVISCSEVQSSLGAGRQKDLLNDFHGGVICIYICACIHEHTHSWCVFSLDGVLISTGTC